MRVCTVLWCENVFRTVGHGQNIRNHCLRLNHHCSYNSTLHAFQHPCSSQPANTTHSLPLAGIHPSFPFPACSESLRPSSPSLIPQWPPRPPLPGPQRHRTPEGCFEPRWVEDSQVVRKYWQPLGPEERRGGEAGLAGYNPGPGKDTDGSPAE